MLPTARRIAERLAAAAATLAVAALFATASRAALDYRDWVEGTTILIGQAIAHEQANLFPLGDVNDPTVLQVGVLIADRDDFEDRGTKNVVLIECGMHAREWYAAESCYWLIDHLLRFRNTSPVRDLLEHVDLWVVPQSNPAGRMRDDLAGGDPTRFVRFCDAGARVGESCSSGSDCPSGGCASSGWRTNTNTSVCGVGVDLARNFSSGWDIAETACQLDYRGPEPFSELEALNLRRFVHNHMISMALVVHANSQEISNQWYDHHRGSGFMTDELVARNAAGSAGYVASGHADPSMARTGVGGGGYGQISSWLTRASDVAGELDQGTERNVSTFFFEIPIKGALYGRPYQNRDDDGSNAFHPSSARMENLWRNALRELFVYVVRQGRSPQCPVDDLGVRLEAECDFDDFGLVGAKLADATDEPGLLDYDATTREEVLPAGTRSVVFAVQNYGTGGVTGTDATVTVERDGVVEATHMEPILLDEGERGTYAWAHSFAGGSEYRVTIQLDPDGFGRNDRKVFAFRTGPAVASPSIRMSTARVGVRRRQSGDRLTYRGTFLLDAPIDPREAGLDFTIHGRVPEKAPGVSERFDALIPQGPPWWDKSRPEKGKWLYRDKDVLYGPVKVLKIRQREDEKTGRWKTKVFLRADGAQLGDLRDSARFRADLRIFANDLVLTSIARGRTPKVPRFQTPPANETENEPREQP